MKLEITLECDTPPRCKKNNPQIFGQGKGMRAIMLPSEAFTEWFNDILTYKPAIKDLFGPKIPIEGPVSLSAIFYREAEQGDIFGYLDAVADAIQVDVWQCTNPKFKMVEVKSKDKKTGISTSRMSQKSDCAKRFPSDVPIARCPNCDWAPMKRHRRGLGIIIDDKQIVQLENCEVRKDKVNPRIELVLTTILPALPPQPSLFGPETGLE